MSRTTVILLSDHRHPRPRRGAPALAPRPRHARRPGDRDRAHRPGSRRPAGRLHPAPRLLGCSPHDASQHDAPDTPPLLAFEDVAKRFTLHLRGGAVLPVIAGAALAVHPGACVVLGGASGAGKSSVLTMAYGNDRCGAGAIRVRDGARVVDLARAAPREILGLRRTTLAYVSQFLRVIARVGACAVVEATGIEDGLPPEAARRRAGDLLARLTLPERVPGITPPEAVATVTANPARATGLTDRVRLAHGVPVVRQVWRAGERVV